MKTFKIPVVWMESGVYNIDAETEAEAIDKILNSNEPVPYGNYIGDSLQIDFDGLEILNEMEENKNEANS